MQRNIFEKDTKNLASQWTTEIDYCPKCGRKLRKAEKSIEDSQDGSH